MKKLALLLGLIATALALSVMLGPQGSLASSHREAPAISQDPAADTTDVYFFRSPDAPDTVSIITNWYPGQTGYSGPNFYRFADDVLYEIHIDSDGDTLDDFTYQFTFRTQFGAPGNPFGNRTFLYNTGPITSLNDTDFNVPQTMTVNRLVWNMVGNRRYATPTLLARDLKLPPVNVGKNSLPNYDAVADQAIYGVPGGGKVFAGQRDDPFFVDLGAVFDLLQVQNPGKDALEESNILTIALQVPIASIRTGDKVIGVWASSSRQTMSIFDDYGLGQGDADMAAADKIDGKGLRSAYRQVSRLGMPLVNEAVIGLRDKDRFNASQPNNDGQFLSWVTNSHLAELLNLLYTVGAPTTNRQDLVTVFLTGVPGLNQPTNVRPAEMLRLNVETPVTAIGGGSRLGVLGGDTGGFPNGRRLSDDVVDIALQVVGGALLGNPNSAGLGDGVNANDKPFRTTFPYLASPWSGNP